MARIAVSRWQNTGRSHVCGDILRVVERKNPVMPWATQVAIVVVLVFVPRLVLSPWLMVVAVAVRVQERIRSK